MKAIRTIVATAVIVFALTTVAMAGVQRLGNGADADGAAQAQPAAAPAAAAPAAVTLSTQQFTALLHAAAGDDAQGGKRTAQHKRTATRTHAQDKARTHTGDPRRDARLRTAPRQRKHPDPSRHHAAHRGADPHPDARRRDPRRRDPRRRL